MYSNFNIATCEEEGFANSFEGIPEVVIFSDDIFGKVAHIVEGFFDVVIFSVINVEEDGIVIIVGVEGVKVCSSSIPLCDLKVQTPFDRAGDQGLGRRSQQTACGGVGQVWGPRIPIR